MKFEYPTRGNVYDESNKMISRNWILSNQNWFIKIMKKTFQRLFSYLVSSLRFSVTIIIQFTFSNKNEQIKPMLYALLHMPIFQFSRQDQTKPQNIAVIQFSKHACRKICFQTHYSLVHRIAKSWFWKFQMSFHFGYEETILFETWRTTDATGIIGSSLGIILMGMIYEGLKNYRFSNRNYYLF